MIKVKNINLEFSERDILKKCFEFYSNNRDIVCKLIFEKKHNLIVMRLVLKYLLKVRNVTPIEAEKIIKKWLIVVVYYYCRSKGYYKNIVDELETLLETKLTIGGLNSCSVESDGIIGNLFNDKEEFNKLYNASLSVFINNLHKFSFVFFKIFFTLLNCVIK